MQEINRKKPVLKNRVPQKIEDAIVALAIEQPAQVIALEKTKTEKEEHGKFEGEHPGYCGAQDTFYVGNLKGMGRIYQQAFIDTYAKGGRCFGKTPMQAFLGCNADDKGEDVPNLIAPDIKPDRSSIRSSVT